MRNYLTRLENESVFIIREAYKKVRNLSMLWSMGKDSTVVLYLVRKAFLGHCPITLVHIDTDYKIPEMISWRDEYVKRHNLRLIIGQNKQALANDMGPEQGRLACCGALKTQALLETIVQNKIQGILVGIRGDEEGARGKERVVSARIDGSTWSYKGQTPELWNYYNFDVPEGGHLRVHPLLRWTEVDIWEYIKQEGIEVMPLYFAKNGRRFRSLGCHPCTAGIESDAATIDDIIVELRESKLSERAGRAQDQAEAYAMQKLREVGYM